MTEERSRRWKSSWLTRVAVGLVMAVLLPLATAAAAWAGSLQLSVQPVGGVYLIRASGTFDVDPTELDVYVHYGAGGCPSQRAAENAKVQNQIQTLGVNAAGIPIYYRFGTGLFMSGSYSQQAYWGVNAPHGTYSVCAYLLVPHDSTGQPADPPQATASAKLTIGEAPPSSTCSAVRALDPARERLQRARKKPPTGQKRRCPTPGAYVALGDSFAAGDGVFPPYVPGGKACHRAPGAYPLLYDRVAQFWACSGAQVSDIRTESFKGEPPQISHVRKTTRLISVSIGGNDAEVFGTLRLCVIFVPTCPLVLDQAKKSVAEVELRVRNLLLILHHDAPSARIYAMGYPNPLPTTIEAQCGALRIAGGFAGIHWAQIFSLHKLVDAVNQQVSKAVKLAAVTVIRYVPASTFVGHDVCAAHSWFNPLSQTPDALHPNAIGNQQLAALLRNAAGPPP